MPNPNMSWDDIYGAKASSPQKHIRLTKKEREVAKKKSLKVMTTKDDITKTVKAEIDLMDIDDYSLDAALAPQKKDAVRSAFMKGLNRQASYREVFKHDTQKIPKTIRGVGVKGNSTRTSDGGVVMSPGKEAMIELKDMTKRAYPVGRNHNHNHHERMLAEEANKKVLVVLPTDPFS